MRLHSRVPRTLPCPTSLVKSGLVDIRTIGRNSQGDSNRSPPDGEMLLGEVPLKAGPGGMARAVAGGGSDGGGGMVGMGRE